MFTMIQNLTNNSKSPEIQNVIHNSKGHLLIKSTTIFSTITQKYIQNSKDNPKVNPLFKSLPIVENFTNNSY